MHWIDPDSVPATTGTLAAYVMNDHGDLDGMVLDTGETGSKLIHFPPHMGAAVAKAFKAGDPVEVRGVRPRGADMVAAIALRTATGKEILDLGPQEQGPPKPLKLKEIEGEVEGVVRLALYAPKGELRGAVLQDGTVLRVGPKEAEIFADLLAPGASVAASGHGVQSKYGRTYKVDRIGPDREHLRSAKSKKK